MYLPALTFKSDELRASLLGLPTFPCMCGAGDDPQKVIRGQGWSHGCVLAGGHPKPPESSDNCQHPRHILAPNVLLQFLLLTGCLFSCPQAPACTARATRRGSTASSARRASTEAPAPATAARAPPWHRPAPAEYVRLWGWVSFL